jgi:hypothetical protein
MLEAFSSSESIDQHHQQSNVIITIIYSTNSLAWQTAKGHNFLPLPIFIIFCNVVLQLLPRKVESISLYFESGQDCVLL